MSFGSSVTEMRALHISLRLYFALAFPFLLLASGARLLLSEPFLKIEYQRPGFPADAYGFTLEDRLAYGPYAVNFLFSGESLDELASLRLPAEKCWTPTIGEDGCALFGERELRHMADVKATTRAAFGLAALCALIGFGAASASWRGDRLRSEIVAGLRLGCRLTLWSVACLAVLSLAAWDRAFEAFHALFFAAGSWRFPFTDSLIRLYPERLFLDAALLIALFASSCALATLFMLGRRGANWKPWRALLP